MKTSLKDILLGVLICAVVFLCVAAAESRSAGRYQVSTGAGYAFVIDSDTGQVWAANVLSVPGVGNEAALRGSQPGFWEKKGQ